MDRTPGRASSANDEGRPRRLPIRFKLAAALAVPVAILLFVSASQISQARRAARSADEQAELALAAEGPGSLFDALFAERSATWLDLAGLDPAAVDYDVQMGPARSDADDNVDAFRDLVEDGSGRIQEIYGPALDALATLGEIRGTVDAYSGPRNLEPDDIAQADETFDRYTAVIDRLSEANTDVAAAIDDADMRRGAELVRLSSRQGDLIAHIIRYLVIGVVDPEVLRTDRVDIAALTSELQVNEDLVYSNARGPYRPFLELLDATHEVDTTTELVEETLAAGSVDANRPVSREWSYGSFRVEVAEQLQDQADRLKADAAGRQRLYLLLGLLSLAAVGVAAWLAARSITRPLQSLTTQATAMADERLPEAVQHVLETPPGQDVVVPGVHPVTVATRDEVADVAQALTTVQSSALELAVEQAALRRNIADSFVNLGRRNHQLLSRQLDFITELEQNESDPESLANLFRLDHLATRMRRNAESLLVLAGANPPRRWVAPLRLVDVIRAALSEVEDYQRVTVYDVGPVTVAGSAAADLAHLLAELIENALVFSSPDQPVTIRGVNRPPADGTGPAAGSGPGASNIANAGFTLAIVDSGMGMRPDEIAQANRRLVGAESFTVTPSKYLGHHVAGTIAARHGISVQLHAGPRQGITATVTLPPELLRVGQRELGIGSTAPLT